MSHFAAMKSPLPVAAPATAGDARSPLFCPKPRRPVAPLRCHQSGGYSDVGMDLLDLLLSKGEEGGLSAASSQTPLFCGSPPRRASNPVVHDSRFGEYERMKRKREMPHRSRPMTGIVVLMGVNVVVVNAISSVYDFVSCLPYWERRAFQSGQDFICGRTHL